MKICTNAECPDRDQMGRTGGFIDSLVDCPVCGSPLVPPAPVSFEDEGEELVRAGRVVGAPAVAIAKSVLTADRICFTTRFEGLQDLFGPGQLGAGFSVVVGPVEFWVPRSQAAEAAALLATLDRELGNSAFEEAGLEDDSAELGSAPLGEPPVQ